MHTQHQAAIAATPEACEMIATAFADMAKQGLDLSASINAAEAGIAIYMERQGISMADVTDFEDLVITALLCGEIATDLLEATGRG